MPIEHKVDIAIIVIAADDEIMPQTKEAISHAQAAEYQSYLQLIKLINQMRTQIKLKSNSLLWIYY